MRTSIAVLMYHAIDAADARAADPHYTVSPDAFDAQLGTLHAAGVRASSVAALLASPASAHSPEHRIALTFDDGHASNLRAAERLAQAGMSADFFVNSSTVGTAGFLSWPQLRRMHAMGMSIQSHGHTHRYLDDLAPGEARAELLDSRRAIEDGLGAPCTLFAPPGGRQPDDFRSLAAATGYRAVCTSEPGYWRHDATEFEAEPVVFVPRLAMLAATPLSRVSAWARADALALARLRWRQGALGVLRRAFGNARYDRLRARLLGIEP